MRQSDPISPLLFVIVMEYLNRILQKLQRKNNFNFHAKCDKLGITNLCFANDLVLFSREDNVSVELMMKSFKSFSNSTVLKLNPIKCHIFFGEVDHNVKENILQLTSFKEGTLPFLYLCVPIFRKKLNIHHYINLADRVVGRITHWSVELLSYVGSIQLLKSVNFIVYKGWTNTKIGPSLVRLMMN